MTEEQRKALTEYLGECWNENSPCKNRTFGIHVDLYAVYSRMVEKKEWKEFWGEAHKCKYAPPYGQPEFTAWLFCLNCPDQIPERMKMAAGWIREMGK